MVSFKLLLDLGIGSCRHFNLLLIFEDLLLVGGVHRRRWWTVELGSMLLTQLSVLVLFILNGLLALTKHFHVDLTNLFAAFNRLFEICLRSFLLELLDLVPDGIGNIRVRCQ